jgi:broad specificity phosphatase PhoE
MILVFETHATSFDNEAGLASGWYDVDLSPAGEAQARALGERRRDEALAAIYSSDLRRAVRTAEIAFGDRGLPIVQDRRLRECDYGRLTRQPGAALDPREQ